MTPPPPPSPTMIPLAVPDLSGNEARYLQECVDGGYVSTVGPFVARFEAMTAAAAGATDAAATSSGTTGLHVALVAVGVTAGDLVIMPALTFIATANAVAHCGADPWLLDVSSESWTLDPERLAEALARETVMRDGRPSHRSTGRRVAAVVPVHTLGLPADTDALADVARRFGLPVVADAAAALGATLRGRPVGASGADLSVFSFNGNKTATAGGGGAVAGTDAGLVGLVRHLSTTARVGDGYDHDRIGFNYRMTNLQAAVGCAQMERLDRLVAAKRRIRARYDEALADLPDTGRFPAPAWAESACWFSGFTLGVAGDAGAPARAAALRERLRRAGIDARPFWKPMHLQAPFRAAPRGDLTVSENIWGRVVTLPCSTGLTAQDQERVIAAVRAAAA